LFLLLLLLLILLAIKMLRDSALYKLNVDITTSRPTTFCQLRLNNEFIGIHPSRP